MLRGTFLKPSSIIYKIVPADVWRLAEARGRFDGSDVDARDGYVHFSDAAQVAETARRHFAGQSDLLLVAVSTARLGEALRWEPSRDGALFPHLYGPLLLEAVSWVKPLPLVDGVHALPALERPSPVSRES